MSADLVVENIRQAARRGDSLTLDALEVIDLDQELLRLYGAQVQPQRSGSDRLTESLIRDLGKTLERHGYRRGDGPAGLAEFALQVVKLTRAFEGGVDR